MDYLDAWAKCPFYCGLPNGGKSVIRCACSDESDNQKSYERETRFQSRREMKEFFYKFCTREKPMNCKIYRDLSGIAEEPLSVCAMRRDFDGRAVCHGYTFPRCIGAEHCKFYKSVAEAAADEKNIQKRLKAMPDIKRNYICNKYNITLQEENK